MRINTHREVMHGMSVNFFEKIKKLPGEGQRPPIAGDTDC